jgi:hypothetical protein
MCDAKRPRVSQKGSTIVAANAEKEEGLSILTGEKIHIPTKIAEMAVFIRWGVGHAFMDDATELSGRRGLSMNGTENWERCV